MNFSLYANASINYDEQGVPFASCYDFSLISNHNNITKLLPEKIIASFESLKKEANVSSLQIAGYLKLLYSSKFLKIFTFDPELRFTYSEAIDSNVYLHRPLNSNREEIEEVFSYSHFIHNNPEVFSSFIRLLDEISFFLEAEYNFDEENSILSIYSIESGEIIV